MSCADCGNETTGDNEMAEATEQKQPPMNQVGHERVVMPCTDMTCRLRNDALLRMAYEHGRRNGFDELEILKRFTLMLLDLKDEVMQEKLDELMRSPAKPIFKVEA